MDTFYGPTHAAKNKMTLRLNFAEVSTAWRAVDIMSLSWVDIHLGIQFTGVVRQNLA